MEVNRDTVHDCVIKSLREILGKDAETAIDEETDPIRGLGLDSADGVDLACALSDKLGYDIPDSINPLVDDNQQRPRKVREIVDLVYKLSAKIQEESHG